MNYHIENQIKKEIEELRKQLTKINNIDELPISDNMELLSASRLLDSRINEFYKQEQDKDRGGR